MHDYYASTIDLAKGKGDLITVDPIKRRKGMQIARLRGGTELSTDITNRKEKGAREPLILRDGGGGIWPHPS